MIVQMLLLLFIAVTVALSSSDELNGAIVDPVKIEGTVVFYSSMTAEHHNALVKAFNQKYPAVRVEAFGLTPSVCSIGY